MGGAGVEAQLNHKMGSSPSGHGKTSSSILTSTTNAFCSPSVPVAPAAASTTTGTSKVGAKTSATADAAPSSNDTTHVVRINVLGLAGIVVNRKKCRETNRRNYPLPPEKMNAVVAVSRGQAIKGTTALSKPLARSPTEDVVVSSGANGQKHDDMSSQSSSAQPWFRHVAVWAGDTDMTLGSMVAFEANLGRLDKGGSQSSTSSNFIPKSFELTVALTENTEQENKVALPIGVANLSVSGDLCRHGETLVLDLPILTLKQARPLASNKNGLGSFKMIAIRRKNEEPPALPAKKRNALQRLFKRADNKGQKVPSVAERKLFSSIYSTDSSGDAILRIQLQVVEKGQEMRYKKKQFFMKDHIAPGILPPSANEEFESDTEASSFKSLGGTASTDLAESTGSTRSSCDASTKTGSVFTMESQETGTTQSDGSMTNGSRTEGSRTVKSSGSNTLDKSEGSSTERNGTVQSESEQTNVYSPDMLAPYDETSENKPKTSPAAEEKEPEAATYNGQRILDLAVLKIFGREVRIPSCGPFMMVETESGNKAKFFDDDITHVTGDFFGRDIEIPICSSIKPHDDDDTVAVSKKGTEGPSAKRTIAQKRKELYKNFLEGNLEFEMPKTTEAGSVESAMSRSQDVGSIEEASLPSAKLQTSSRYGQFSQGTRSYDTGSLDPDARPDDEAEANSMVDTIDHIMAEASFQQRPSTNSASIQFSLEEEDEAEGPVRTPLIRSLTPQMELKLKRKKRTRRSRGVSESLAEMFQCAVTTVDDAEEVYDPRVPGVVIPSDGDESLGDLTAITHEKRINRRSVLQQKKASAPFPVALGGDGLCTNYAAVDDRIARERLRVTKSSSTLEASVHSAKEENYFLEYDDYSIRRPRTKQSVDSVPSVQSVSTSSMS